MSSSFADVSCVLKVNVHCQACKMKMIEVLGSVIGVYSVDMDAREGGVGLATVCGEVEPNLLLKALARTGMHAEIHRVSLRHPMMDQHNRPHPRSGYAYGYGRDTAGHGHGYGYYNSSGGRRFNNYNYGAYEHPSWYGDAGGPYHRQSNPMGMGNCNSMPCGGSGTGTGGGRYGPFNGYGPGYMSSSYSYGYADHDHLGHNNCSIM